MSRSHPFARGDYLARSGTAALAMFLPNVRVFVVLLALGGAYSPEVRAAVGLAGTISGIVLVLATGFVVTTIRACTPLLRSEGDAANGLREPLRNEFASAAIASLLLTVTGIAVAALAGGRGSAGALFSIYWLAALPATATNPIAFVLNGAFQSLHRDRSNLVAAIIGTVIQGCVASSVVLAHFPPALAVGAIGGATSVAALSGIAIRGTQLARAGMLDGQLLAHALRLAMRRPIFFLGSLRERVAASVDGLVFLATFTVATLVAVGSSVETGASIALAVSLMRATIVPLKQFGIVGARFYLRERGGAGAISLLTIQLNCVCILALTGLVIAALRLTSPQMQILPWSLVALMLVQLICEPWAGITYSYRKITDSAYRGLPALFVSYLGIGIPALVVLHFTGGVSPTSVWLVLLVVRLIFVALQLALNVRQSRELQGRGAEAAGPV